MHPSLVKKQTELFIPGNWLTIAVVLLANLVLSIEAASQGASAGGRAGVGGSAGTIYIYNSDYGFGGGANAGASYSNGAGMRAKEGEGAGGYVGTGK
ncbi:hypothetical protein TNCV_1977191 [Trichonephila clavipes]|nr:hypothetical protein TNCV_1977191 [Trichonephila clavipes]